MILSEQIRYTTTAPVTVAGGVTVGMYTGINTHHISRSVCCGIDTCLFQWSHDYGIVIQ
ncbi:MAG: hypothetical protein J07HQW1_01438 [Haloquadratum walsbyi J07HQW1]|uniref:Uncharacterized protein n=1 Tax=Haloquadratum walsbyi J07HQW1 TaxID=1238424 RepID=U1MNJ4_9EURY|nr:MAG: hypothetical protein J07HQW1_01438 [Haloquadratum walsbyi J07HQW1]